MFELLDGLWHPHEGYFAWTGVQNPFPLEFLFWAIVLAVAILLYVCPRAFAWIESALTAFCRRRLVSVIAVGVAALALRAALLPLIPVPVPAVHDEFSYLLQSDTFAHGRLTNPSPPMWTFFESFHINVQPTYQSMYPPAQAVFLAIGERLTGIPWLGVWLSVGLMCATICWMLQAWMPPPWPLVGGLFCVLRFAVFSYWMNSYMGGAVAAIGGALALGAVGRLRHRLTLGNSVLLGLGLAILANSRPYEGFVFSVPLLVSLLIWIRRRTPVIVFRKLLLPAGVVLACTVAFMLYYNWRGTGNPVVMPYRLNQARYHITNMFLWQPRNPIPEYDNPVMRKLYVYWELPDYVRLHSSPDGLRFVLDQKFECYYTFFIFPIFLLFFPACYILIKSPKYYLFPAILLTEMAALFIILWAPQPHYAAPVLGAVIATAIFGLRLLRTWRPRRRPVGKAIARAVVVVMAAWLIAESARMAINPFNANDQHPQVPHQIERARVLAQLRRMPGRQLLFVKSRRDHNPNEDWVYNGANIDQQKIVWARDMGREMDAELIRYYAGRHVWIVDQDDGIHRLTDYDTRPSLAWSNLAMKMVQSGY